MFSHVATHNFADIFIICSFFIAPRCVGADAACAPDKIATELCTGNCSLNTTEGIVARESCPFSCGLCREIENLKELQTPKDNNTLIYKLGIVTPCMFHSASAGPREGYNYWRNASDAGSKQGLRVGEGFVKFEYVYKDVCLDPMTKAANQTMGDLMCAVWFDKLRALVFVDKVQAFLYLPGCVAKQDAMLQLLQEAGVLVFFTYWEEAPSPATSRFALYRNNDPFFEVKKEAELHQIFNVGIAFSSNEDGYVTDAEKIRQHYVSNETRSLLKYYDSFFIEDILDPDKMIPLLDKVLLDMQAAEVQLVAFVGWMAIDLLIQRMYDLRIYFDAIYIHRANLNLYIENKGALSNYLLTSRQWATTLETPCEVLGSNQEFVAGFVATYGYQPSPLVALGAVLGILFQHAMTARGSFYIDHMVDALETLHVDSIWGPLKFSADHVNIGRDTLILQIQNSKVMIVKPSAVSTASVQLPQPSWDCRDVILGDKDAEVCSDLEYSLWRFCLEAFSSAISLQYNTSACRLREQQQLNASKAQIVTVGPSLTPSSSSGLRTTGKIVGGVIGGTIFFLFLAVAVWVRKRLWRSVSTEESQFWITKEELIPVRDANDQTVVAGMGAFGLVFVGMFRGTKVAVKSVLPKNPCTSSSFFEPADGSVLTLGKALLSTSQDPSAKPTKPKSDPLASIYSNAMSTGWVGEYKNMLAEFEKETALLMKIRHPHIVTVLGACMDDALGCCMVMEFMECGSLYDLLHNHSAAMGISTMLRLLLEVACGIQYLHEASPPIIHGDIKSLNILLGRDLIAKVADFGTSIKILTKGGHGTVFWMAPEMLVVDNTPPPVTCPTPAIDIYSFGMTMWETFTREEPYKSLSSRSTEGINAIKARVFFKKMRPDIPAHLPMGVQQLIQECWSQDPQDRPTIRQVRERLEMLLAVSKKESSDFSSPTCSPSEGKLGDGMMMHQGLPLKVSSQLSSGFKVEPEEHDPVTICLSGIVGYKDMASELPPGKMASLLDRLYAKFDILCSRNLLFKVETEGNAYMCVGGLPECQVDHTRRVALFALGAVTAANSTPVDEEDPSLGCVNIRVGFHSGPVVASVVGDLNPQYCLFGDTVSNAFRMEMRSMPSCINLSPVAHDRLKEQVPGVHASSLGLVGIVGKGETECFVLDQSEENYQKINLAVEQVELIVT